MDGCLQSPCGGIGVDMVVGKLAVELHGGVQAALVDGVLVVDFFDGGGAFQDDDLLARFPLQGVPVMREIQAGDEARS